MATIRTVRLGDGRDVRLGAYVAAWRTAVQAPPSARFKGSPRDPQGWAGSYSRADVLREFRDGLADRINRRVPWFGRGRKWKWEWQRDAAAVAWKVNGRIVTRERDCPPELRRRLAHRFWQDD